MRYRECLVQRKMASKIMQLHLQHALPVNIIVGDIIMGLQKISLEFEESDSLLVEWLINKGTEFFTEGKEEDD